MNVDAAQRRELEQCVVENDAEAGGQDEVGREYAQWIEFVGVHPVKPEDGDAAAIGEACRIQRRRSEGTRRTKPCPPVRRYTTAVLKKPDDFVPGVEQRLKH